MSCTITSLFEGLLSLMFAYFKQGGSEADFWLQKSTKEHAQLRLNKVYVCAQWIVLGLSPFRKNSGVGGVILCFVFIDLAKFSPANIWKLTG